MRVRIIEPTKHVEKPKERVCAYARVSTVHDKQGESLENQIQYYERMISNNADYEFAGVFADRGITGTTENRPEFQKMLELCREGKIDLIITKSISRFARNTALVLETVRELKDMGVGVRFEKENIETMSGDGELMLTVLSSFAQEESKNVSDNLKWRVRYDRDEFGELAVNEEQAKIVRRIFTEYLEGKGTFVIAKEFNKEKVPTVAGGKWYGSTVLGILKNEKYKGDALFQRYYTPDRLNKGSVRNKGEIDSYYIEDNRAPIVTREIWDRVQKEIKRRVKAKGNTAGNKYTKRYKLSEMLYCSRCGPTLRRRTWNSRHSCKKIVWQCGSYIKNGKDACQGTTIDDEVIGRLNIKEPIIIKEEFRGGKKHYSYTSKGKQDESGRANTAKKKENGSVL
ncbi:recombinase family protein [Clostridium sp. WILCCON 0269]|uniref:Recombinase family protein n=1 Tax=Candidatus Clostridium eludens TaxID=3381663 RepID=A0ABW8SS52_9CLOT